MAEVNCDIRKLSELLKTENDSSESDDDLCGMGKIGPGDVGKKKSHAVSINKSISSDVSKQCESCDPDAIWKPDEVVNQPVGEGYFDPREQPEYEIKYQQSICPEDVFLQMNARTSLTSSCENMIITVHLRGETKGAIDLTITNSTVDIRSPLYRLHLPLPHPVNAEKGRAEWDSNQETLRIELLMTREFDFINF